MNLCVFVWINLARNVSVHKGVLKMSIETSGTSNTEETSVIITAHSNDSVVTGLDDFVESTVVGNTIMFELENIGFHHSLSVTDSSVEGQTTLEEYSLDPGYITISPDPASLVYQVFAPGSKNVVLWSGLIEVDQPISGDSLHFNVVDSPGITTAAELNATFGSITLYVDSYEYSPARFKNGFDPGYDEKPFLDIMYGFGLRTEHSRFTLVGNISDNAPPGVGLTLELGADSIQGPFYPLDYSGSTNVESVHITGSVIGPHITVEVPTLTVFSEEIVSYVTVPAGTEGMVVLETSIQNNDVGDVNVTRINFDTMITGAFPEELTVSIFVGDAMFHESAWLDDSTQIILGQNFLIPSGTSTDLVVFVDRIEGGVGEVEFGVSMTRVQAETEDNQQYVETMVEDPSGEEFSLIEGGSLNYEAAEMISAETGVPLGKMPLHWFLNGAMNEGDKYSSIHVHDQHVVHGHNFESVPGEDMELDVEIIGQQAQSHEHGSTIYDSIG